MSRFLTLLLLPMLVATAVAAPGATSLSAGETLAGRKLYVNKCAKCHQLYEPRKYSDADWKAWLGKMSRKSKLTPEQQKSLSAYVDEQLRSPKQIPGGVDRADKGKGQ